MWYIRGYRAPDPPIARINHSKVAGSALVSEKMPANLLTSLR
jgi:hypothetical protein